MIRATQKIVFSADGESFTLKNHSEYIPIKEEEPEIEDTDGSDDSSYGDEAEMTWPWNNKESQPSPAAHEDPNRSFLNTEQKDEKVDTNSYENEAKAQIAREDVNRALGLLGEEESTDTNEGSDGSNEIEAADEDDTIYREVDGVDSNAESLIAETRFGSSETIIGSDATGDDDSSQRESAVDYSPANVAKYAIPLAAPHAHKTISNPPSDQSVLETNLKRANGNAPKINSDSSNLKSLEKEPLSAPKTNDTFENTYKNDNDAAAESIVQFKYDRNTLVMRPDIPTEELESDDKKLAEAPVADVALSNKYASINDVEMVAKPVLEGAAPESDATIEQVIANEQTATPTSTEKESASTIDAIPSLSETDEPQQIEETAKIDIAIRTAKATEHFDMPKQTTLRSVDKIDTATPQLDNLRQESSTNSAEDNEAGEAGDLFKVTQSVKVTEAIEVTEPMAKAEAEERILSIRNNPEKELRVNLRPPIVKQPATVKQTSTSSNIDKVQTTPRQPVIETKPHHRESTTTEMSQLVVIANTPEVKQMQNHAIGTPAPQPEATAQSKSLTEQTPSLKENPMHASPQNLRPLASNRGSDISLKGMKQSIRKNKKEQVRVTTSSETTVEIPNGFPGEYAHDPTAFRDQSLHYSSEAYNEFQVDPTTGDLTLIAPYTLRTKRRATQAKRLETVVE